MTKTGSPDQRRKGMISNILPKEALEPLLDFSYPQIAKQLNSTIYIVKNSLIVHNFSFTLILKQAKITLIQTK